MERADTNATAPNERREGAAGQVGMPALGTAQPAEPLSVEQVYYRLQAATAGYVANQDAADGTDAHKLAKECLAMEEQWERHLVTTPSESALDIGFKLRALRAEMLETRDRGEARPDQYDLLLLGSIEADVRRLR